MASSRSFPLLAGVAVLLPALSSAQSSSCSIATVTASYPAPSVAAGYTARLIANGFQTPRDIVFDTAGNLLVVESGKGITAVKLTDNGGSCLGVASKSAVLNNNTLNHGIALSADGRTLYASNSASAMGWSYDPSGPGVSGAPQVFVDGMDNDDHTTRTLLISTKVNNTLLVSRGSTENIDSLAANVTTGHSQLRSFDVSSNASAQDFSSQGTRLAWGLRNSVGVAEHPISGGIWTVENSADNIDRNGQDIHTNNPGEELNFHGYLNGTKASPDVTGANFGYPDCYAVWNLTEIPNPGNLKVGSQFELGDSPNDTNCANNAIAPILTFPAHWAPLDIKFNSKGSVAWITSHGSWNRDTPTGYLLYAVPFNTNGTPVAESTSTNSWTTIVSNANVLNCPGGCFRPVGLAFDSKGRLFMTSDSTGEIYVITKSDGTGVDDVDVAANGTSGSKPSAATRQDINFVLMLAVLAFAIVFEAAL